MTSLDPLNYHILLIAPLPPPAGGISTWTKTVLDNSQRFDANTKFSIVDTRLINDRTFQSGDYNIFIEIYRAARIFKNQVASLFRQPCSLVHIHSSGSSNGIMRDILCGVIARLFRKPVLTHFHRNLSDVAEESNTSWYAMKLRILCGLSEKVIVLNQNSETYLKSLKIPRAKLEYLPNFVHPTPPLMKQHYKRSDRMRVAFVGAIIPEKGYCELLKIATVTPDVDYHLFGKIGKSLKMNLPDNVHAHGQVEPHHLQSELRNSDMLLFLSHSEGFPMAILESMAIGLPIVSTPVGAVPDMLEDECLVDIGDLGGTKQKILLYASDEKLRRESGSRNHHFSTSNYAFNVIFAQLREIYSSVLTR